jgi:hypothetical protein
MSNEERRHFDVEQKSPDYVPVIFTDTVLAKVSDVLKA